MKELVVTTFQKTTFLLIPVLALAGAFVFAGFGDRAQAEDAGSFSAAQKAELQTLLKDYLMENPQVIMDSVAQYQQKQQADMDSKAGEKIAALTSFLEDKNAPSVGSPNADVVVVEFFDYNCGYCKKALDDIIKITEEDKNVRFVFHDMPILGPTSLTAAKWAYAAHKQGKYFEYHKALMKHNGPKNDDVLEKFAKEVGMDVDAAKTYAASDEVMAAITKSMDAARDIGINGTPAFIIGDRLDRGYIGPEGMREAIKQAHEKGKEG